MKNMLANDSIYRMRNIRKFFEIVVILGLLMYIYFLKQRNWTNNRYCVSVSESYYPMSGRMNDKNCTDYKQLLQDLGAHDKWLLSAFLKKTEKENNLGRAESRRRICILNVDTRPLERFSVIQDFDKMNYYSIAAYNSLFYAIQNGYDYRRVTAPPIVGYSNTWVKISHLYDTIDKYDIVVLLDADAYVRHPNMSMEYLLARYNFTRNTSFLMASDPGGKDNQDSKGRATLNTGFIIAQNNNLTKHLLRRLALCAETIPGCKIWKTKWTWEQRAFSEYIRDEMKEGSELIIAPCNDLNGFEESRSGCSGSFVLHTWTAKKTMAARLKKLMLENLMIILDEQMQQQNRSYVAVSSDVRELDRQIDVSLIDNNSSTT